MTASEKAAFDRGLIVGMGLACSEALSYNAGETAISAVLNAAGLTTLKKLKDAGLEEFDLAKLRPVIKAMQERDRKSVALKMRVAKAGT